MLLVRAGVVKLAEVAPEIGFVVVPELPRYHWNVGEVPEAATVSVVVVPLLMVMDAGLVVIAGSVTPCATLMVKSLEIDPPELLEFSHALSVNE